MPLYEVKPNQTLPEVVADAAPHLSVEQVRTHAKNQGLFATRTEYLLRTGDKIWIPEEAAEPVWFKLTAGECQRFLVSGNLRPLRLALRLPDGEPARNADFELQLDGAVYVGKTDEAGMLDLRVPITATRGLVKVNRFAQTVIVGGLEPITTVRGVQGRLANLGFQPGPVDGDVGRRTTRAIEAFQRSQGLEEDGVVGPITRDALKKAYGF
jgi:Putative peptidoglycan binding domain